MVHSKPNNLNGLVGFGNIGKEVAKRVKIGLEMEVTAWTRRHGKGVHREVDEIGEFHWNSPLLD
ncbi:NAD(P)-dependent oxidoreductase [Desulfosporosinus orientis]|uniref:NAD(P)-dependent oxidoreductase n=1 Tax=Desulfosporosinus orientis TaxID=1563 RepID=UPI0002DBEC13|nr:NAD(P)-dependent oxidoreductase [Desulfosporosinus orientis]